MKTNFRVTQNGIQENLNGMINRANTIDAYLNTVLLRQWQKAQMQRWQTENASEGDRWIPIDPKSAYGKRKAIKYASYPGAGKVTMVATGRLVNAATGRGPGFLKQVSRTKVIFGVSMDDIRYASRVAEDRPYMDFSDDTESKFLTGIANYMMRGAR